MYGTDQYPNECAAVTPSDTVGLSVAACGFVVGVAGNVTVVTPKGAVVTFTGCPVGFIYPIAFTRINATGTTATGIVAFLP